MASTIFVTPVPLAEAEDALRVGVWERPQEHAVDDAEDGARRADAQRERQDRDGREGRTLPELPEAEDHVVPNRVEPFCACHVPLPLSAEPLQPVPESIEIAERPVHVLARGIGGRPCRHQLVDPGLDVKLELVADVARRVAAPEAQVPPPRGNAIALVVSHEPSSPEP